VRRDQPTCRLIAADGWFVDVRSLLSVAQAATAPPLLLWFAANSERGPGRPAVHVDRCSLVRTPEFFHSYWRRPEAYLESAVRRGTTVWSVLGREVEDRAMRDDLVSGVWRARNETLLALEEAELGARLLTT